MMNSLCHNIPTIDLHGENRDSTRVLVNEFINDNYKMGIEEVAIIHGIGEGILKKEVHKVLRKSKIVKEFGLEHFNNGCTLVKLLNSVDKTTGKKYNTHHNTKGE